eukprot:5120845-Heterocapsa_arctica.AAC.1
MSPSEPVGGVWRVIRGRGCRTTSTGRHWLWPLSSVDRPGRSSSGGARTWRVTREVLTPVVSQVREDSPKTA